jgi:hypothetical protein
MEAAAEVDCVLCPACWRICTAAVVVLLKQPEVCSADDASLWLRVASYLGGDTLSSALSSQGEGGDPDLLGAALQRLLGNVSPQGDLAAVMEASMERSRARWNQGLAEATVAALPKLDMERTRSQELFVACLALAQRHLAATGSSSLLVQLLRMPETVASFKALERGQAVTALDNTISSLLSAHTAATPAAVRSASELLQLSAVYGSLPARAYGLVIETEAATNQKELALASLTAFFQSEDTTFNVPGEGSNTRSRCAGVIASARSIMSQLLVNSTDVDLMPHRHLALDLAPSAEMARQLLSAEHPQPLPTGFLLGLLLMAKREAWGGVSGLALAALSKLPPAQQAAERAVGGDAALCSLLLRDAAGGVAGRSLLSPLLDFIALHNTAAPLPSGQPQGGKGAAGGRLALSAAEWRALVGEVCWCFMGE